MPGAAADASPTRTGREQADREATGSPGREDEQRRGGMGPVEVDDVAERGQRGSGRKPGRDRAVEARLQLRRYRAARAREPEQQQQRNRGHQSGGPGETGQAVHGRGNGECEQPCDERDTGKRSGQRADQHVDVQCDDDAGEHGVAADGGPAQPGRGAAGEGCEKRPEGKAGN